MKTENYKEYFVFLPRILAKRYSPLEGGMCRLQYDGNADYFPGIVEHISQSKRIPPKYLGFPRDLWLISFTS